MMRLWKAFSLAALRVLMVVAAALVAMTALEAQPARPRPLLAAADLRPSTSLDGQWNYSIDPYRDGMGGFHGGSAGTGHRRYDDVDVSAVTAADPLALYEYDLDHSPVATLPSSWLTHDPTMRHYEGLVWYQRRFAAAPIAGMRQFLRFGAVNYSADVYLNGRKLGHHEGGFTPFAFEVTGLVRKGDNRLVVGVDSERNPASVPPLVTDWESYGGITRSVSLIETPATYVDDAWIRLGRDGRIAVDVTLDGAGAAGQAVRFAIPALGLKLDGHTDGAGRWTAHIPAPRALHRWSPDSPSLYDVTVEAGADHWRDRVGFRTVEVRGARILLNGRPIFLRGICMHEEELGSDPTRAITPAAARALLTEVKTGLHGNFVRLAHYPHSEVTTRMADEIGLLLWSEVPVYWLIAWDNPETLARARAMVAENILRDRNRASIILWSVGNETPIGDARNAFLGTLADDVRTLDPDRLVTAALLTGRKEQDGHAVMVMADPLVAKLDVMAINTYNGWYTGDALADLPKIGWQTPADKPLIFSELGADALAGFHDPATKRKFSEEFQADYYRQTLAMAAKIPNLVGMSPWILKDFRSPRRQHPVYQQGWNRKGLISETGRRKQAFDILAAWYAERAKALP
ncbi:beta-glucuronidase [Sphingomonas oligophenolica]|uniref:Glycoside hydrolase family 2 TIM barrel-domain containing protein n=1 Tax=Sphingomonas oligophenolica TaxID=301154 RepID=A0ABU9Y4F3_9SPHN